MKRIFTASLLAVFLWAALPLTALGQDALIPVGKLIGLHIRDDTVTVAAFDEDLGSAAQEAGLKIGDRLLTIEGRPIESAEDIQAVLSEYPEQVTLTIARGEKRKEVHMAPQEGKTGPRLGIYLRQGISGIGTVTWYDPDSGRFGTLGHGVSSRQGMLVPLAAGSAYNARISSVVPGRSGQPGLLKGIADADLQIGSLYRNTAQGVFGTASPGWEGDSLPVASFDQVHPGEASIFCTVSGEDTKSYSVEILKVYDEARQDCRNFLLKVTDPSLLSATGGIVQGMSGSPILQDGRIIGAVTHVMVSDPTTGYGIFIGNMLDAAA